jgi:hypothetical protein
MQYLHSTLNGIRFALTSSSHGSHVGITDCDKGRGAKKRRQSVRTGIHENICIAPQEHTYIYLCLYVILSLTNCMNQRAAYEADSHQGGQETFMKFRKFVALFTVVRH